MASPDILDFDRLLAPISEESPSGVELKEDAALNALFYQIKDAREAARTAERQMQQAAMFGEEGEMESVDRPDWRKVEDTAIKALTEHTKDLWIAAWLIEALTRRHGFAGLRDGFRLTWELAERYWDGIHPRPDEEDGYAHTVAQLTGLNGDDAEGALISPIEAISIVEGSDGPLSSIDYRQASELEQITDPDRREQRISQGAVTLQEFDRAVAQTSADHFRGLLEDIQQAEAEFAKLGEVLEPRCGKDEYGYPAAPPTSNIRNALSECRERITSIARHLLEEAADSVETGDGDGEGGEIATVSGGKPPATGGGMNREDAFRALLQVADFFRRTEPHSPVSYALEQAVRWGRMSLADLMSELINDESARDEMFRRVGIPKPESSDDD
jgi:type VI secretion system protein ImpA